MPEDKHRWLALLCAAGAALGSGLVLAGWLVPETSWFAALSDWRSLAWSTAGIYFVSAIVVAVQASGRNAAPWGVLLCILAVLALALPLGSSIWSAGSLICLGASTLVQRRRLLSQILALQPLNCGVFGLILQMCHEMVRTYYPNVQIPKLFPFYVPILVSLGMLLATPSGFIRLASANSPGAGVARRLAVIGILGPVFLTAGALLLVKATGQSLTAMALMIAAAFCWALASAGIWMGSVIHEHEVEREERLRELSKLRGDLVTMCAWTHRIRDGEAWVPFEEFLRTHFDISVTHGMAPQAAAEFERRVAELVTSQTGRPPAPDSPTPAGSSHSPSL